MKNVTKQMTMALLAIVGTAANLSSAQTPAASVAIVYEWRLDSGANPALPEVSPGGGGAAYAPITPGDFNSGWMAESPFLGAATGMWDLGRNGTLTLTNLTALAGGQAGIITVKVTQYQGGPYEELADVSIIGAVKAGTKKAAGPTAKMGGWVVDETQWQLGAGGTVNSVVITGGYYGSLVDRVVVESSSAATQPPVLAIRAVGGHNAQVEVSWSSSSTGVVLESTPDINNPAGWAPVEAKVQTTGNTSSVTTDAVGSARFYRLKKP